MNEFDSTTQVLNTFEGSTGPPADLRHHPGAEFIERVSGEALTPANAEDVTCQAVRQTLDLVRHFAIPDNLEPREEVDDEGFVYHVEWWTKGIAARPFRTLEEAADLVKRDIEAIYTSIDRQKFCHQAREHVMLFGDWYDHPEDVNRHFERVASKLAPTMMIAPETVPGLYTATHRYGFDWFIYLYHDFPELTCSTTTPWSPMSYSGSTALVRPAYRRLR
jgi:hypothetical protein